MNTSSYLPYQTKQIISIYIYIYIYSNRIAYYVILLKENNHAYIYVIY